MAADRHVGRGLPVALDAKNRLSSSYYMREEIIEYLFAYIVWTVASLLCCIWFFKAVIYGGDLADLESPTPLISHEIDK